ncbi:MAG: efflux RND transporter periplasmic adaptor subunit [Bacteroidales bacterium]|nr:efflux RND transporter periplasmic adaptor subunit [Bacteroidales bacterium]
MNYLIKSLVVLGMAVVMASCSNTTESTTFQTVAVQRKTICTSIIATGIIKPKVGAEVRVGSRASGIVKRLHVKIGDEVRKGDLLANLDDSELSARYRLEMANLDNAQTVLKYAKIEMGRAKSLVEKDFSSIQSYDNLVKEYDMALSRVASVQASVDYALTELGFTQIVAPISGVIGSVSTQEGETVSASFSAPTFVTIIDLSRIEVWAYVDETDIGKIEIGQKTSFTLDTYTGNRFEGTVSAIYPKAEIRDNVVNYIVIIEISDNMGKILRPEMTASVTIQTSGMDNVLSIPNNAIKRKNAETVVYILENGNPIQRKIKTGIKGPQITEVMEGLKENDQVIINSEELFKNKNQQL